jgi:hypothetical protein
MTVNSSQVSYIYQHCGRMGVIIVPYPIAMSRLVERTRSTVGVIWFITRATAPASDRLSSRWVFRVFTLFSCCTPWPVRPLAPEGYRARRVDWLLEGSTAVPGAFSSRPSSLSASFSIRRHHNPRQCFQRHARRQRKFSNFIQRACRSMQDPGSPASPCRESQ